MATPGLSDERRFTDEDLRWALRNREMPLEALRYEVTPTGLHYLLCHFDIPVVSDGSWKLDVGGRVERRVECTLNDLRSMPAVEAVVTLECAGNGRALMEPFPGGQPWRYGGVSTARWRGVPLTRILDLARCASDAVDVVFTGEDEGVEEDVRQTFQRSLPLEEALRPEVLVAFEMNGEPVPPQHGGPVRLVVPGWYGMASVKWLTSIEVTSVPFEGFQQMAYEIRQDDDTPGERISRMLPRSLIEPPGLSTDDGRLIIDTSEVVRGRAWSGFPPIVRVEVSSDDGISWHDAQVEVDHDPYAWSAWRFPVEFPEEGTYVLRSRAWDAEGRCQPVEPVWNAWGYQNNVCDRVPVVVSPRV